MLEYNFSRIFKAKGILAPTAWLIKNGFSDKFASGIAKNRYRRLNLGDIERLCKIFQCTPNDVMEWKPDKGDGDPTQHALASLYREDKVLDLTKTLNSVSFDKLLEIEKLIQAEIEKY